MTMKKLFEKTLYAHTVKVLRNAEWHEYVVRLDDDKKSDYFTTDKQDALDTAEHMIQQAAFEEFFV
jgi:hypothetical protein